MLIRNIIEIALIIILFIVGIVMYLKRRINDAESDLVIRKKKEIKEDTED